MSLDTAEKEFLDRQITLARPIALGLALVSLRAAGSLEVARGAALLLGLYFFLSLGAVILETTGAKLRLPLAVDVLVLALLLMTAPSAVTVWLFFAFVSFSLASAGWVRTSRALIFGVAAGVAISEVLRRGLEWQMLEVAAAIGLATFAEGEAMRFLGERERRNIERRRFLERLSSLVQFDRGLGESVRQVLGELTIEFDCEHALLVIRDDDVDRLFVWQVRSGNHASAGPESLAMDRADAFLADSLEVALCWNAFEEKEEAFGWDRRTGQFFRQLPPPGPPARDELHVRSLLAATVEEAGGRPAGRILLVNPHNRRRFAAKDLRWLEQVVRHISLPLENVFRLRHLRARSVEAERSRISRDLHDGILQTMLSLTIQLDVLRRKVMQSPAQAAEELGALQKLVKQEGEDFRKLVTDLRPVRVESADLRELMFGFAERFRNEAGVAVDLFVDDRDLRASERICREVFQIYRESLNNIKKHANASHVVVKLEQDETKLLLVVDDNGQGFSFSGRYSSEDLDRLRLGPISIKERARAIGGVLTVESNPGHGARLIVELPLS